ncbi:MAG: hypothetical protein JWR67_690 [Mucilaginibacter sp.]|nr:hypothetical protein [Mucilaginibacter sp.]
MNFKYLSKGLIFLTFFLFYTSLLFAQTTKVSGVVTDASNKQPLPYVTVSFQGSSIGAATDNNGRYSISTTNSYNNIKISFVGYKDVVLPIVAGKEQVINVKLIPEREELDEVEVKGSRKQRYRNKDNPAVELIRKVIANKEKNRPESYNYVEYREYDKMQFSFTNVSSTLADKKFFRKYKFVLDNRDTTTVPGVNLLPIYIDERLSQYYYRKNPEKDKTLILGQKTVDFGGSIDIEGLGSFFKYMYSKVDIYDNNINLITNNFLSPIANESPTFYKFFITDTITTENNSKLVELSFTPRNTQDMLFEGKIYITLDGNYAVQKAKLGINKNINLNFVKTMEVDLDFEQNPDGRYHLSKSNTLADFGVTKKKKGGLFGIRTITYKNYIVNKPHPDTTYVSEPATIASDEVKHKSDQFWAQNRLDTLTKTEANVYKNIDSLRNMPSFKRTLNIATLLLAGYYSLDKFEIGPSNTFYSFNPIEGLKLRIGGRTTPELSKRYYFETYAAYGFKDKKWKYFLSGTYSLNNRSVYQFPQNYLRASFQRDTKIPGLNLQFVQQDNFLLSFKRGINDKYLYNDFYKFDYVHEYENHFSYSLEFRNWKQSPAGSLYFINNNGNLPNLTTTEANLNLRYAPHEEFYQGKIYRVPVPSKYPVFSVDYTRGFKGVFNGSYNYQNLHARIDKRVYLSQLGYADASVEASHIFGQVPYPLLDIFQANQTYAYSLYSYNLMNFLEFVGDHYESINIDQHFVGFFLNKIPLLKKLKWREVVSFKAAWGGLSDLNNPALHPSLYQFPVTSTGQPITYALGGVPYMEGSVGIENIFKFLRVDLVRRFDYLDHPEISKYGIRARVKLDF